MSKNNKLSVMNTEAIRKSVDKRGIRRHQLSMFSDISKIYKRCPEAVTKANQNWVRKLHTIFNRYGLLSKNQSEILFDILRKVRWRASQ